MSARKLLAAQEFSQDRQLSREYWSLALITEIRMRLILALHALLMLLASTEFTIVTAIFGGDSLRWCCYRCASQSGFGRQFVSDYTLPVVLGYLATFAVGIAGFSLALRRGRHVVGLLGVVLSMIGVISFAIEGSHWIIEHHRSWIAFSPAVMFILVLLACLPACLPSVAETKPTAT